MSVHVVVIKNSPTSVQHTHTYVLSITISLAHGVFVHMYLYVLCGIVYGTLVIFYDFFTKAWKRSIIKSNRFGLWWYRIVVYTRYGWHIVPILWYFDFVFHTSQFFIVAKQYPYEYFVYMILYSTYWFSYLISSKICLHLSF